MSHPRTGEAPFNPEKFLKADSAQGKGAAAPIVLGEGEMLLGDAPFRLHLLLYGTSLDPDAITRTLLCQPDESRKPTEAVGGQWVIQSAKDIQGTHVDTALAVLLGRLAGWEGSLLELPGVERAVVWAMVDLRSVNAIYRLKPRTLELLGKRNLDFRVSLHRGG